MIAFALVSTTPSLLFASEAASESASEGGALKSTSSVPTKPDVATAFSIVGASVELSGRHVSYTDLVIENLRTYGVTGAPILRLSAELYPLSRLSRAYVLRNLGLGVMYAGALGLSSALPDATSMSTSFHRLEVMLRLRQPIFKAPGSPVLGAAVGYAHSRFLFDAPDAIQGSVPSVSYHALRFALDGRVPLGPVAVRGEVGYRMPLAAGALLERFRDGSVGGVDLSVGVAVPIKAGVEARLGFNYTRYFYSFYPNPGDPYIAGGALDEYIGFEIGAAHVY